MAIICRQCNLLLEKNMFSDRQYRKYKNTQCPILCLKCSDEEKDNANRMLVQIGNGMFVTHPKVFPINGASYFPNFLSDDEQNRIIEICDRNRWTKAIKRRQQFYGEVYYHTRHDNAVVQPLDSVTPDALPIHELQWLIEKLETKEWADKVFGDMPFPTQILVNEYVACDGIASHFEDEEAFGPIIATISLINPILMTLVQPREHNNDCEDLVGFTKVLLQPGSLFVMKDDCRYQWRHGISRAARVVPLPDGSSVLRTENYRRISLTIRHLESGRRRVQDVIL